MTTGSKLPRYGQMMPVNIAVRVIDQPRVFRLEQCAIEGKLSLPDAFDLVRDKILPALKIQWADVQEVSIDGQVIHHQ